MVAYAREVSLLWGSGPATGAKERLGVWALGRRAREPSANVGNGFDFVVQTGPITMPQATSGATGALQKALRNV